MFAKLKKFNAPDHTRRHGSAAAATACNDNHSIRRFVAASRPTRRPILRCHWHRGASGALECVWNVEAPAAGAADEPEICSAGRAAAIIARCLPPFKAAPSDCGLK
jgi:hypothetical protein